MQRVEALGKLFDAKSHEAVQMEVYIFMCIDIHMFVYMYVYTYMYIFIAISHAVVQMEVCMYLHI